MAGEAIESAVEVNDAAAVVLAVVEVIVVVDAADVVVVGSAVVVAVDVAQLPDVRTGCKAVAANPHGLGSHLLFHFGEEGIAELLTSRDDLVCLEFIARICANPQGKQ